MILSILIPTLPERTEYLKRLNGLLIPQVEPYRQDIEIVYHDAGRSMPIGQKRNELLNLATGDYTVFIDDDDIIMKEYISSIMYALISRPDVVTFNGFMTTNGKDARDFVIRLDEKYEERNKVYYRFPNHLCPMRVDCVRNVRFPSIRMAEDYEYAKQIHDMRLLKTEVHIPNKLYHYDFRSTKPPYGSI